jgi:hypothetical protein
VISQKQSGALDILVEKLLGMFLPKDESIRRSEEWEALKLSDSHVHYAALDVVASRLVFEKASEIAHLNMFSIPLLLGLGLSYTFRRVVKLWLMAQLLKYSHLC